MCLLVVKRAGADVPEEHIKTAWARNKDGGGMAWHIPGNGVDLTKGYFTAEELIKDLKEIKPYTAIIHMRFATHGSKREENCHPYLAGGNWVMGHNGVFGNIKTEGDESDTAAFIREYIKPMLDSNPKAILEDKEWIAALEKASLGSKLAFLNTKGETVIIHEKSGHWLDDVWYSNASYKPWVAPKTTTYSTSGHWENGKWVASYGKGYTPPQWKRDLDAYSYGSYKRDDKGEVIWNSWEKNPITLKEHMLLKGWVEVPGRWNEYKKAPKNLRKLTPYEKKMHSEGWVKEGQVWVKNYPREVAKPDSEIPSSIVFPFQRNKWPTKEELEVGTWPCHAPKDMLCDCCGKPFGLTQPFYVHELEEIVCEPCKDELFKQEAAQSLEEEAYGPPDDAPELQGDEAPMALPEKGVDRCEDDGPRYVGSPDDGEPETGDFFVPGRPEC